MQYNLNDKVVVITGSSRGIGKELALAYAKEGARIVINYCNDYDSAIIVYNQIRECGCKCILVKADVSKEVQVKELYCKAIAAFGSVDILVNNAGINSDNYILFMDMDQWNNVLNVNLTGTYLCSRYFSKNMMKNNGGKIINIASLKGQRGSEGQSNYSASKSGIIGLSKALARELGNFNIAVNVVCPGYISTDLNKGVSSKKVIAEQMSTLDVYYGLSDLINFVMFLSSDLVKGISGQIFNLDSRIK